VINDFTPLCFTNDLAKWQVVQYCFSLFSHGLLFVSQFLKSSL
jgi:hypothetical protein